MRIVVVISKGGMPNDDIVIQTHVNQFIIIGTYFHHFMGKAIGVSILLYEYFLLRMSHRPLLSTRPVWFYTQERQ